MFAVAADGTVCVVFTNILDSLTASCLVYNKAMYTVAGAASMAGAWFIHWPVWPMRGLYGPAVVSQPFATEIGHRCLHTATCDPLF